MTSIAISSPPHLRPDAALFLDFDGTLVDIADTPTGVVVPTYLPGLLADLARRLDGSLAIVSGRRVEDIRALLHPFRGVTVGLHGLEYSSASGELVRQGSATVLAETHAALLARLGKREGVTVEDKELTLAVHYRGAPHAAAACIEAAQDIVESSAGYLKLQAGKMVVEIAPAGADKGSAIAALMREPPFRGRLPVFVGDDVTDEDGFVSVNALGGVSARVGDGDSVARYCFPDVEAVTVWLSAFAGGQTDRGARP